MTDAPKIKIRSREVTTPNFRDDLSSVH